MYLYLPKIFFVPFYYIRIDDLDVENIEVYKEKNYYKKSVDRFIYRKDIVIGVSFANLREPRWARDKEAMEKEAKEKGITLKIENAEFDLYKQISQIESLISQDIDVLIIIPLNIEVLSGIAEKSHSLGTKVISYEELITNSDIDLFVSTNNIRVGEFQGKYLIQHIPNGKYIILSGEQGGFIFKQGSMEYIQPLVDIGNVKIVADKMIKNWDPKIAYEVVKEILIANKNKVDAILAPNDGIAGGAIEALRERGLAGKVAVTGQDAELAAVRRIIEGTQSMTVLKDSRKLGKIAINAAIKLANGEVVPEDTKTYNGKIFVPTIFNQPIEIDKSNIDSELINSGYYRKEEIYPKM